MSFRESCALREDLKFKCYHCSKELKKICFDELAEILESFSDKGELVNFVIMNFMCERKEK